MKAHVPTPKDRDMVSAMTAYGIPQKQISAVLKITEETLVKHYREEIDSAAAKANAQVAEWLYGKCRDGDVTSMIFWLKARARWVEKYDANIDLNIIPVKVVDDLE